MSGAELLASLVGSLAWPAVAITAVMVLRGPVAGALADGTLKAIKVGAQGVEADFFEAGVRRAQADLPPRTESSAPTWAAASEPAGGGFIDEMSELAKLSPSAAVLEAFARLEKMLRRAVRDDEGRDGFRSVRDLGRLARHQGLLGPGELAALDEVIALRNAVAHVRAEDLNVSSAVEYARVTFRIMLALLDAAPEAVIKVPETG